MSTPQEVDAVHAASTEYVYPESYPVHPSPKRRTRAWGRWFALVHLLLVLLAGGLALFITMTLPGQKMLNAYAPTTERTLAIMAAVSDLPQAYSVAVTKSDVVTKATLHGSGEISGSFAFSSLGTTPSTTIEIDLSDRAFRITDGAIYVADLYGDRFVPVDEAYVTPAVREALATLPTVLATDFTALLMHQAPGAYVLEEEDVNHYFIKVAGEYSPWIVVRKEDYALRSILLSSDSLNLELSPLAEAPVLQTLEVANFGDLLARESVAIRTEMDGRFDDLWHRWEEAYFDCFRCVNRIGDSDGDQLDNTAEFVLGTDPLAETATSSLPYPEAFIEFFANAAYQEPENGGRNGFIVSTIAVPDDARAIAMTYTPPSGENIGNYLTVYFNDTLAAVLGPTPPETEEIAIPIAPSLRGTTMQVSFVLNSVGERGANIRLANIGFLSGPTDEPLSILLRNQGYTIVFYRDLMFETVPVALGENQWLASETPSAQVTATKADYNGRVIPAVRLSTSNPDEPAVITRRMDLSNHTLPTICVSTEEGFTNGTIKLSYLPDGEAEYIPLTIFGLSTILGSTKDYGKGYLDIGTGRGVNTSGTLAISVVSNGEEEAAAATFAQYEYIPADEYDSLFTTYGATFDSCADIAPVTEGW